MAVRTPLYNNAGNIQEMSAPQIQSLKDFIKYRFYTLNPVDLQVDVGNGTIGSIDDTRLKSGTQANSSSSFPNEATTGEPQTVTTSFNNIKQVLATTPTLTNDTGNLYPVYYDSQNNIQAMNLQDMKDTLIHPVIDDLASTNDTTGQAGTFFISSSTTAADTNKEVVSTTPVYTDTRANTSSFLAANIPAATNSTLDYPTSITNYYIHKNKPLSSWASGFTFPFKVGSSFNSFS